MQKIHRLVQEVVKGGGAEWSLYNDRLVVYIGDGQRHQDIRVQRQGADYVLTSVVLDSGTVKKETRRWYDLARLAWQRNAEHQLVTFGFDKYDRLVGQIRHPAEHLDAEELEIYVRTLARECDRFEYLLSGEDTF